MSDQPQSVEEPQAVRLELTVHPHAQATTRVVRPSLGLTPWAFFTLDANEADEVVINLQVCGGIGATQQELAEVLRLVVRVLLEGEDA